SINYHVMQIWIIKNEEPTGPFDVNEVRRMKLDPATPVWFEGLADWRPISAVPELADCIAGAVPEPVEEDSELSEVAEVDIPEVDVEMPEVPSADIPEIPAVDIPEEPTVEISEVPAVDIPEEPTVEVPVEPEPARVVPEVPVDNEDDAFYETAENIVNKKPANPPSNYLAFSIVVLIFCCLPTGIVALIYSTKVNNAWYGGDHDRARRYSEMAEWWIQITIVLGLIWTAFSVFLI
ncbi:MAG: CD225/dispanin family protein, partial [Muribaculaceae bacterium]|nr:CD225/dispanin family protein [Muribaculaceae bacterium]